MSKSGGERGHDVRFGVTGRALPAGRPVVEVSLLFQANGTLRDVGEVRERLEDAAGAIVNQLVTRAITEIEGRCGVKMADEPPSLPWVPMQPAVNDPEVTARIAAVLGVPPAELEGECVWRNDLYFATVRVMPNMAGRPSMAHLSVRRFDRAAVRDWRHLQNVKNDIFGPEMEACELYPAESRLVDQANQYHLWVFTSPGARLPFGFADREVTDTIPAGLNARQRPWHPQDVPADVNAKDLSGLRTREIGPAAEPASERSVPPWTAEQVRNLNGFQRCGLFHEFTCGGSDERPGCRAALVATPGGWVCPTDGCTYTQDWAHGFMADGGWREAEAQQRKLLADLKGGG